MNNSFIKLSHNCEAVLNELIEAFVSKKYQTMYLDFDTRERTVLYVEELSKNGYIDLRTYADENGFDNLRHYAISITAKGLDYDENKDNNSKTSGDINMFEKLFGNEKEIIELIYDKTDADASRAIKEKYAINQGEIPADILKSLIYLKSKGFVNFHELKKGFIKFEILPKAKNYTEMEKEYEETKKGQEKISNRVHANIINKGNGNIQGQCIKIGIITALPKEFAAMEALLDSPTEESFDGRGAGRRFSIGKLSSSNGFVHQVALAMCGMGNNYAAIRATNMLNYYPDISLIIMTGIAGGIPNPDNVDKHVRLGDIVVSNGIIQYDLIKNTVDSITCRSEPPKPSSALIEAVDILRKNEYLGIKTWEKHIDELVYKYPLFKKPDANTDILFDEFNVIVKHPNDSNRTKYPKTFYGKVGSANTLLKNPKLRNVLKENNIHAVEMESSGIADATWNNETGYIVF